MKSDDYHIPVMLTESIDALVIDPSGVFADGTLGGGGHTAAILERTRGTGRVLAFDADPGAIEWAARRFSQERPEDLLIRQAYFSEACEILESEGVELAGVLLDLGVSSRQLDSDQIGLSYRSEMPLDMRFDPQATRRTAREIVMEEDAGEIATLLRKYGEEPAAWKIAQTIVQTRRSRSIDTTSDLREIIESVIPQPFLLKTLSRVFQALRIEVNDELGELRTALEKYTGLLKEDGRFVVLTYHSLEDRIVKDHFRLEEKSCVCPPEIPLCRCGKRQRLKVITRKPALPSAEEIAGNPRARSAKLRIARRVVDSRGETSDMSKQP